MPCGGIYPVRNDGFSDKTQCSHCHKALLPFEQICYIEEWDDFIHNRCVYKFIRGGSHEARIIIAHGHIVETHETYHNRPSRRMVQWQMLMRRQRELKAK